MIRGHVETEREVCGSTDWRLKKLRDFGMGLPGQSGIIETVGRKVFLFGGSVVGDSAVLREVVEAYERSRGMKRAGMCFDVSLALVQQQLASGKIWSNCTDGTFLGYYNHCLNFRSLPMVGVLGFDVLAGEYIDRSNGNFDILAIFAEDMEALSAHLSELYGGEFYHA